MSVRDDILNQLKKDIQDKVHEVYSDNYTSSIVEVRRGIHSYEDMVNRPCVGFALREDELDEEVFASTGNDQVRFLHVDVYGYVDVKIEDDYEELHTLVRDLEYFFKYDFTYSNNTTVGNVRTLEGGVRYPVSYFDMEVQIQYMNEL